MKAEFAPFSKKQLMALSWWCRGSPHEGKDALICDGAVRSGKTLCMSLSFVAWAFYAFSNRSFALCGKTVTSLRRNVVVPLLGVLKELGFHCEERVSKNYIDITLAGRGNRFYLFGGKDESSAALIQGMTLGGVLFDEVALMPRSFVEQALARCSVAGSKYFFNCNPEHPHHWFYLEWIKKAREKNALLLHFEMSDNPSLALGIVARYQSLYSGVFYERFVKGRWVAAQGLVYPMFEAGVHLRQAPERCERYYISCDYGTVNPSSFGLWGLAQGCWHRLREYYFDSRREGFQKTDEEHYLSLEELAGGCLISGVVVDPSAASFIETIRRHGRFSVLKAKNDVLNGIRRVCDALKAREILFDPSCKDSIREFALYRWEEGTGRDAPVKENDHAMDDIRYFVSTVLEGGEDDFFVTSAVRT
ncbi:phage terminase, large subunit, PBSX family [Acetanaerobacterium elongatum]|uniref:Phage terminase, large subunit, PBSX family n=2 Tax=Acetanaerobacterium elongatum TaxID=258515 RepID=A0A1H0EME5_9FIRM|nr:phage terminase, large subunit, PBSX family [Acetanaerobacterium elongatum]